MHRLPCCGRRGCSCCWPQAWPWPICAACRCPRRSGSASLPAGWISCAARCCASPSSLPCPSSIPVCNFPPCAWRSSAAPRRSWDNCYAASPGQRLLRSLASILLVSFFIQLALLPLSLLLFNNSGLWFLLNVFWLPVLGALVLPGAFLGLGLSLCGLDAAATLVLDVVALPCQWLVDGLLFLQTQGWLSGPPILRPHWTALPAMACLFLALALRAGRPALPPAGKRLLICGLLLACAGPALRLHHGLVPQVELSVPDVGQAQAVLLRLPHGQTLLVDAAGSMSRTWNPGKELLLPLLACNARPGLDTIINSHPDIDHAGGIPPLLTAFPEALLLHNGQPGSGQMGHIWQTTLQDRNAITLHAGDILQLGDPEDGLALHVLHPPRPVPGAYLWEGNSASLILRLVRNGHGLALFPGDADGAALRHLLASGQDVQADVLLAPHHGSDSSFQPDFLAAVRPRLVVASCGAFNRFGHPGKQLGQWLEEQGILLLQTGRHGHVRVVWPLSGDPDSPQLQWDTARPVHP